MTKLNDRSKSLQKNGLIINLNEVPKTGESFYFDQQNKDLRENLKDLIGDHPFSAQMKIMPHVDANCYSLSGNISTHLDLICSRCALDFEYRINENFNEIILIKDEANRHEHYAGGGQITPTELNGPYCTLLPNDQFNAAEFLHEIIALAEPYNATAKGSCDDSCENFQKAIQKGWIQPPNEEENKPENPFNVLKEFKLEN